jgi:hypothetical protein
VVDVRRRLSLVAAVAVAVTVTRTTLSGGKWTRIAGPATAREPEATRQRSAPTRTLLN